MNLQDKKILAEWMKLTIGKTGPDYDDRFWINDSDGPLMLLDKYNPDTNPEQFKEVINKMTGEQCFEAGKRLPISVPWPIKLKDHMPEVIEAVLEVIKEK